MTTQLQEQLKSTQASIDVIAVVPNRDYTLTLTFCNRERKRFDMKPYIERSDWFKELRSWEYFSQVRPDYGTIVWPHGQDLCPDTLYENGAAEI